VAAQCYTWLATCAQEGNEIVSAAPMFLGFSYPMELAAIPYDQTGRNLKRKIPDGGLYTWKCHYLIVYLNLYTRYSNKFPSAIPRFLLFCYAVGLVEISYNSPQQTNDRNVSKWYILKRRYTCNSACTQNSNEIPKMGVALGIVLPSSAQVEINVLQV